MAKPRIIYNNLWRKGTMGTVGAEPFVSSEDPQHPALDTQVDTLSMYWKASVKTSPVTIPIYQGATPGAIDFVAILGHNIEPTDVTIKFQGADNAAFDSGLVTKTLNHNVGNIREFFTTFTKQYVRLRLEKGTNFTDYPKVATIFCGSYFELNKTVGIGYEEGSEDFSELEYSDSQVLFAQEKEKIDVKTLPFLGLDNATRANILLFFKEVGIHKAFVICFNSADPNNESHWVVNAELINPRYEQGDCWHWQMRIREIV